MRNFYCLLTILGGFFLCSFSPAYQDSPFLQEYSIRYYAKSDTIHLWKVGCDRNGDIKIMTSAGLFKPYDGQFLYPGTLEKDHSYRPVDKKKLTDMLIFKDQFVYLDDQAVFSNAWAGKLFDKHALADARLFEAGEDFNFLIASGL